MPTFTASGWVITNLLLLAAAGPASASNILFYFGLSGHSQVSSIWPVIEVLGERGHHITLLTSIPPKNTHPAVSVVHVPEMFDAFKDQWGEESDLIESRLNNRRLTLEEAVPMCLATCSAVFTSPSSQNLLYNSTFDLVIMDTSMNDCALGLAALHYKCPLMVYNALSVSIATQDDYGIPVESSWIPEFEFARPVHTFWDRLFTTWQAIKWLWIKRTDYYPQLSQIFVDHLKLNNTPDFLELQKRTSLILMNAHYAHGYALSLPPLYVNIAGIGIQDKRKELPAPLDNFIATGKDGFIYISFGTQVTIHKSKPELRVKFFNAFANFPNLRFVWKWNGDVPAEAPSNIYFSKWMPQQDLLAHPNIKGYIAHGGMNGVNEGVHYSVPMIVFPIMGDQDYNANALEAKGLAIVMQLADFDEKKLTDNINVILHDEAMKARVKKASAVFNDRPMKPVETAVWWIEYVMRHGDTSFLMPGAVNQTWYQRRLLDVWLFVYTVLMGSLATILYLTVKMFKWIVSSTNNSTTSQDFNKLKRS